MKDREYFGELGESKQPEVALSLQELLKGAVVHPYSSPAEPLDYPIYDDPEADEYDNYYDLDPYQNEERYYSPTFLNSQYSNAAIPLPDRILSNQ